MVPAADAPAPAPVSVSAAVPEVRVVTREELQELVTQADAVDAVRRAFADLATAGAQVPAPLSMVFPDAGGELHVKAAHLHGSSVFAVKAADGFPANAAAGLPTSSGLVLVFDATTGLPLAVLLDGGLLTDLRTGAGGAVAADLLAAPRVRRAAVLGAGTSARYQLDALLHVRDVEEVVVWARDPARAEAFAQRARAAHGDRVRAEADPARAVAGARVVVTCTPARSPVLRSAWVEPGTHVTAMGSDMPGKQEVEAALLGRADLVVADSATQARTQGEVRAAVEAGVLDPGAVRELADLVAGRAPGRTGADQVTVADLTGVGVADAAMAQLVCARLGLLPA